jgi:hypothetical protein
LRAGDTEVQIGGQARLREQLAQDLHGVFDLVWQL